MLLLIDQPQKESSKLYEKATYFYKLHCSDSIFTNVNELNF